MAKETLIIQIRADGTRTVKRQITSVGKSARKSATGVDRLKGALKLVAGLVVIRQTIKLADAYTVLQNRLRVVVNGTDDLNQATKRLLTISTETRSSLASNAELFARLSIAGKELGATQEDLFRFTESLNQAIKLSGASAIEASAGLIQLSQGMSSNRLSGDELRSVLEQLPVVADVIAKRMGVTRGELRKLGSTGKITGRQIIAAFKDARVELAERFAKTIPTVAEGFVILGNSVVRLVGEFSEATFAGRGLFGVLKDISGAIEAITEDLERTTGEGLKDVLLQGVIDKGGQGAVIARLLQKRRNERRGPVETPAAKAEAKAQRLSAAIFDKVIDKRQQEARIIRASGDDRAVLAARIKTENALRKAGVDIFSAEARGALDFADLSARGNLELQRRQKIVQQILGPEKERIANEKALNEALKAGLITDAQRIDFLKEEESAIQSFTVELNKEIELLGLSALAAERRVIAMQAEQALLESGIALESDHAAVLLKSVDARAKELQLLQAVQGVVQTAGPAKDEQLLQQQAINVALEKNFISQDEANLQLNRLAVNSVEASDGLGGLASSFLSIDNSARALGQTIGDSLVGAIKQASFALADFVVEGTKGVEDLKEAVGNILKSLLKQILAAIFQALILKAITGDASGGGSGGLIGLLSGGAKGRRAGGPVRRGEGVIVGEKEREFFVPPSNGRIETSMPQGAGPAVNVTVVNSQSEDETLALLAGAGGEQVILNVISKNPEVVKQAIG